MNIGAKVLILGRPNTGKSTLVKDIEKSLTIAYDGKPYPFKKPHAIMPEGLSSTEIQNFILEKIEAYAKKFKEYPKTLVIDAVSRIFSNLEAVCLEKFKGFDIWSNLDKEVNSFTKFLNEQITANGINIILIGHTEFDEKANTFKEVLNGKFKRTGFISTTDECVYLEVKGKKRIAHHRNMELARTFVEELPDNQPVDELNFKEYFEYLIERQNAISSEDWNI